MAAIAKLDCPLTTDGEIAVINLESARRHAWARFAREPRLPGVAEAILDNERLALEFLGDLNALHRLEILAEQFAHIDDAVRANLVQAEVASAGHRFGDARRHLTQIAGPRELVERQLLSIDQACGAGLDAVLAARRRIAAQTGRLEDLVPLGAVLTDLERFAEAERVFLQALEVYDGVSPFPPAWACFQLGMLWGELVPAPDLALAAAWYERAIAYLPSYIKARVHLAEIYTSQDRAGEALALLLPAISSSDPEANWRLADVLIAQGRFEEGKFQLEAARIGFEELLRRHPFAFADHVAEFYAGSSNDHQRALYLARMNARNRPTRRAIMQVQALAAIVDAAVAANDQTP